MFTAEKYVLVNSLEEAYQCNQSRTAIIVGGMHWLKMSKKRYKTVIDLNHLELNKITENNEEFSVDCMVTLRQLELHRGLNEYFGGAFQKAVKHIVGTQFRNTATIGGSVYGRYGFSDVLTLLMALDSYVELYKMGVVPLSEYAKMDYDNDIVVRIIVKKNQASVSYLTQRLSETDFPILACCVTRAQHGWKIAVGARPKKAMLVSQDLSMYPTSEEIEKVKESMLEELTFESNMRGSGTYRSLLSKVFVERGIQEVMGGAYGN